jgi:hypothetical protein
VYALHEAYDGTRKWYIASYGKARHKDSKSKHYNPVFIICATEAGPPPDDWKPEEAQQ